MTKVILSRKETKYPDNFLNDYYGWDGGTRTIARCETVFWDEEKHELRYAYANKLTGINRHSGARWYRWENTITNIIRKNKQGRIVYYTLSRIPKQVPNYRTSILPWAQHANGTNEEFKELLVIKFGILAVYDVHPVLEHYTCTDVNAYLNTMHNPTKANNLHEFVEELFGKGRYRKSLARAVAEAELNYIAIAQQFKGLVPIDWIITYLERHKRPAAMGYGYAGPTRNIVDVRHLRKVLIQLNQRSLRNLLLNPEERRDIRENEMTPLGAISEVSRFHREYDGTNRIRTWQELNNHALQVFNRNVGIGRANVVEYTNRDIPLTDAAKTLKDLALPVGMQFVLPHDTDMLHKWSAEMGNCIRGYSMEAVEKRTTLAGLYDADNKLLANLEIKGKYLKQFLGKFNQTTPHAKALEPILKDAGFIVDDYWGKERL